MSKNALLPLASLEAGLRATAECVCQGERCPQRGGKDAAPGMKGALGLPGGRQQLTPGASPRTCPHPLHPRSTQPKPFRASPSRAAIAVSPTVHQLRPLPSMGGTRGGAGAPGMSRCCRTMLDFGDEGCALPLFSPRDPQEGVSPAGAHFPLCRPHSAGSPGVTSLCC